MSRLSLFIALLAAAGAHAQSPLFVTPEFGSSGRVRNLTTVGDAAYFSLQSGPGTAGTWQSGGTLASTTRLSSTVAWTGDHAVFAGTLYVVGTTTVNNASVDNLYRIDGASVVPVTAFATETALSQLTVAGGRLLFSGGPTGGFTDDIELYAYDGTSLTRYDLNANLNGDAGSLPNRFTVVGDDLYFWADSRRRGPAPTGNTLWRASAGQAPVEVLGLRGDTSYGPGQMIAFGGTVYFTADRPDGGPGNSLYRLDGASAAPVGDFATAVNLAVFDGALYFAGDARSDAPDTGLDLWRTTGAAVEPLDLPGNPLDARLGSEPGSFVEHRGALYFSARALVGNRLERRLWRTDGTTSTIVPGLDPVSGPILRQPTPGGNPDSFTSYGDDLALWCETLSTGTELCLVDGDTGRLRVLDVQAGGQGSQAEVGPMAVAGGVLLFSGRTESVGNDVHAYDARLGETTSTLTFPFGAGNPNAERLSFYHNVGLRLESGSDITGTGTATETRIDAAPVDRTGIPSGATVACRWEVTATGLTFDPTGARAVISPDAHDFCFSGSPPDAVLYYRPTIGQGAFTALTTNASQYATLRRLRYTGPMGFGEYALGGTGIVADEPNASAQARTIRLAGANPARMEARIRVEAPVGERVVVTLVDALGRRVGVVHDGGAGDVRIDTARLAPGLYAARLGDGASVRFTVVR